MKMINLIIAVSACLLLSLSKLDAQTATLGKYKLQANQVSLSKVKIMGKEAVIIIKDSAVKEVDEPTFAKLADMDFTNGIIEVKVLSRLLKNAPEYARGFIGLAFRINDSNTKYESIYIRPTNGRADDQVRRNHSIQYYSYPDFKFDRLRKESPEKYESYADMALNQWITMRVEVKGEQAKLFINDNQQPSLVVNDLKHGANASGAIGLWVEIGTEGYFRDLKVVKQD
jgi:hypothetical protein